MKHKSLVWYLILIFLVYFFYSNLFIVYLNNNAIKSVKLLLPSKSIKQVNNEYPKIDENQLFCNFNWLNLMLRLHLENKNYNENDFIDFVSCSSTHMHMVGKIFPSSYMLAEFAVQTYPKLTFPLYWIFNLSYPTNITGSKLTILKILSINSNDGIAWRFLGKILLEEGNIPGAIEANINCCKNLDPLGSNGCYHAGRLLEQEGRYKEALIFYRSSRWPPSHDAADRLESELSSQNP